MRWIILAFLLFFAGCVTNAQDVISRDCNTLENNLKDQCYFEKSLYYSLLGDYPSAIDSCKQIEPRGLDFVEDFFLIGTKANLYNKCITNVALSSRDENVCKQTTETSLGTLLFGAVTTDSYDECVRKLDSLQYQESQLPTLLNRIFTP